MEDFVHEHRELKKQFKTAKAKLRDVFKTVKPLTKKSSKLLKLMQKIDAAYESSGKRLPAKWSKIIDDLKFWSTLDIDLTF